MLFAGWVGVYADRTVLYPMLGVIGGEFRLSSAAACLSRPEERVVRLGDP